MVIKIILSLLLVEIIIAIGTFFSSNINKKRYLKELIEVNGIVFGAITIACSIVLILYIWGFLELL